MSNEEKIALQTALNELFHAQEQHKQVADLYARSEAKLKELNKAVLAILDDRSVVVGNQLIEPNFHAQQIHISPIDVI